MNDKQLKDEMKSYLHKNVYYSSDEKVKLFDQINKKKRFNIVYYAASVLVVVICFLIVVSNIGNVMQDEVLKFSPAPFSSKGSEDKEITKLREDESEEEIEPEIANQPTIKKSEEDIIEKSNNNKNDTDKREEVKKEKEKKQNLENEEKVEKLAFSQMESIMINNLEEINAIMSKFQSKHKEWLAPEWALEPEKDPETYKYVYNEISKDLSGLMTEKGLEMELYSYIGAYFCYCDVVNALGKGDIGVRLNIVEQTLDSFKFSYVTLSDIGSYKIGTNIIHYIKEDDVWKFNGNQYISPEEKPLNIIRQDLDEYHKKNNINGKIITEEYFQGGYYFIVNQYGFIEVINKKDGSSNSELKSKYIEE